MSGDGDRSAEQCGRCALLLRWCGNCRGVAGPFDRYCGFCGFELMSGRPRNPFWRLWLLVALVPLAVGLGYGLWVAREPAALGGAIGGLFRPVPGQSARVPDHGSPLGIRYQVPRDWTVVDYTVGARPQPAAVISRTALDQSPSAGAGGDLTRVERPLGPILTLSRPPEASTGVLADARDPVATLSSQVATLVAAPPPGLGVQVTEPVRAVTIGDRRGAEVVLRLRRGASVLYLRRDLVYAPHAGDAAMLRLDALASSDDWPSVNRTVVTAVVASLRFVQS